VAMAVEQGPAVELERVAATEVDME